MLKLFKNFFREESGQDLIEYALIGALIAVALILSMQSVASGISKEFSKITAQLT